MSQEKKPVVSKQDSSNKKGYGSISDPSYNPQHFKPKQDSIFEKIANIFSPSEHSKIQNGK